MDRNRVLVLFAREEHDGNWSYVDSYVSTLVDGGFETVVISNHASLGFRCGPSAFFAIDFADPDRDRQILEISKRHGVQYAMSLGDWAANVVGTLNAALELPGYRNSALKTMIHKNLAYRFALENQIRMPASRLICERSEFSDPELQCPIIIKPTHGTGMVKIKEYDYQIFPSLEEFAAELEKQAQLEDFLATNRAPGFFGAHMVQKYILHDRLIMVNFAYIEGRAEILQIGRHYYPGHYNIRPFAVGTPEPITAALEQEIRRIIDVFQARLAVGNTFASIQFLIGEGDIPYPIDIHLRLGEAKGLLLTEYEPHVFLNAVRGMLGRPYTSRSPSTGYRMKYSFMLKAGEFEKMTLPDPTPFRAKVCNMHFLEDSKAVPVDPSFENLGSYFILESEISKEDCWQKAREFINGIKVRYRGEMTTHD